MSITCFLTTVNCLHPFTLSVCMFLRVSVCEWISIVPFASRQNKSFCHQERHSESEKSERDADVDEKREEKKIEEKRHRWRRWPSCLVFLCELFFSFFFFYNSRCTTLCLQHMQESSVRNSPIIWNTRERWGERKVTGKEATSLGSQLLPLITSFTM